MGIPLRTVGHSRTEPWTLVLPWRWRAAEREFPQRKGQHGSYHGDRSPGPLRDRTWMVNELVENGGAGPAPT